MKLFNEKKNLFSGAVAGFKSIASLQWRRVFQLFTRKEKVLFFSFLILVLSSLAFLSISFYFECTVENPAFEGTYTEGVVGRPRFINPLFATSDVDRDLSELVFSGLLKYDKQGEVVLDLAREYEVEEGKVFNFKLKEAFWHDGQKVTADDVVWTVKTIQDPEIKSPLMVNWLGVMVEKISEDEASFRLTEPYPRFIENATLKILPAHIFKDIPKEELPLVQYNFKPVGSGPFMVESIEQERSGTIKSLKLTANENYFGKKPYISQINFLFFESEKNLIDAAQKGQVEGFTLKHPGAYLGFAGRVFKRYSISLPRYFALFFNLKNSELLKSKTVRKALNYGTDKREILQKIFSATGTVVDSPILPNFFSFNAPENIYEFDQEKARELLEQEGFLNGEKTIRKGFEITKRLENGSEDLQVRTLQECLAKYPDVYPEAEITGYFGDKTEKAVIAFQEKYSKEILESFGLKKGTGIVGESTRKKLNEICPETETVKAELALVCPDQDFLVETANILKEQWAKLGISLKIEPKKTTELKEEFIKKRSYESLLFGEVLGLIPDPFPFWHSSQAQDPGLNLSLLEDETIDKLLEEARKANAEERVAKQEEFQEALLKEAPAVFLYNPDFVYLVSYRVKGIEAEKIADPSKRFVNIENWYVKTKRVLR